MSLKPLSHIFSPLLAALAALAVLLAPASASALLSGSAELEYVRYDAEKNGSRELDATSFRHNYSLSYNTAGSFMGGRLGAYKGMLGYEWGSFDTTISTPSETLNPSISRGNLLYSGDLLVDPRELPLRLSLYSRDTLRSNFQRDTVSVLSAGDWVIDPGLSTDITGSGTHIETGATLRLGIKNGMTNGYNAIFRHVPLLLLNYSDRIRKDDKAQFRIDTRLRKLAFISLNKKDNWFHYRVTKFTDNITPAMSYSESQVQLGTVDERLHRQWIDITNWIKLSTDIQFSKRQESGRLPVETYDANLFLIATRTKWELRNFSTFSRQFDYNARKVRMDRAIPVYLSGIWGQEADWSVRLVSEEETERPVDAPVINNRDLLASYRINTFNRSRFTLSHTGEAEHFTGKTAKTLVLAGSLQTASTRRFSDLYRLSASYSIKRFDTETQGGSSTSMAHDLKGKVNYQHPSRRFSLDFTEDINIVDGVSATNSETTIYSSAPAESGSSSISKALSSTQGYKRFNTAVKVDWTPLERLQAGISVIHEMLSDDGKETKQNWTAQAHLRYKQQRFTANISSAYSRAFSGGRDNAQLQASADAAYFMSRDLNFGLRGSYTNMSDSVASTTNMDFVQDLTYRYMGGTSTPRKILEVSEQFTYNRIAASSGGPFSGKKLTLGLHYYPWAVLSVSNRASYAWNGQTELIYNGSVTLSYPKLQTSLDYSYGTRDAKNDKRKESRIAANVKKFF